MLPVDASDVVVTPAAEAAVETNPDNAGQ